MAQSKGKGQTVLLTGVIEGDDNTQQPTLDEVFGHIKADLGGEREIKVKVERVDASRGGKPRLIYCDAYPLEDVSSEDDFRARIRDEWGGGIFRLWCHDGRTLRLNRQIEIAERKTAGQDELGTLRAQVAQLAQRPPETEEQVLSRLKLYKDLFAPGGGGGGSGDLQAFLRGVEFQRGGAVGGNTPVDMIKQVLSVVDGAKKLRESIDPHEGESLLSMGIEALRTIGQLINKPAGAGAGFPSVTLPPQLADSTAAAASQAQPAAPAPAQPEGAQVTELREMLLGVHAWAKIKADSTAVAELLYGELPDNAFAILQRPDWFELFVQVLPEAKPFEAWYRATHAKVLEMVAEDAEAPPPAPAP